MNLTELKVYEKIAADSSRFTKQNTRSIRSRIDKKSSTNRLKGLDYLKDVFVVWDAERHLIRNELRSIGLARAYISGKKYDTIEQHCYTLPDVVTVASIIRECYDTNISNTMVERWMYNVD